MTEGASLAIGAIFDDAPEKDAAVQRLPQNQPDVSNVVKPYYSKAARDQLTALLKKTLTGAAALLTATRAGDTPSVARASPVPSVAVAYLGDMLAAFLVPDVGYAIHTVVSILPAIAEIWMVGYLLVKGVKVPAPGTPIVSAGPPSRVVGAGLP